MTTTNRDYATSDELDIITRIRGEVMGNRVPTGENLFLAWGYPAAFFLLLQFVALLIWNESWCSWIWLGTEFVGIPLMVYFLRKDYERTGHRSLDSNVILQMWIYIGCACVLLPHGCHPALPSQDRMRHHCQSAVIHSTLLPRRTLAGAVACHRHRLRRRPHHSRTSV